MKWFYAVILLLAMTVVGSEPVYGFGKNKVIYKDFEWYYIQSKHFDIYFYEGGQEIAEFTAEIAESAYVQLQRDFRFDIRERIVFIVYNSHNDWQQTNVVISYLEEGIGGVTELYKNRIVVPFEGSYEQFRHVIHHELVHAVMNDMLYGGSVQSLIVGEVTPAPLWFSEGLAEFQSQGWDTRIDMIVRDAVLNNYMPNLQALQYYLVYQGGASVFRYIASTYGRDKIGEMLHKMRGKVAFEKVLRSSVGVGSEEFTDRWHRYLRRQYWPDVADRKEPVEFAKRLTDHTRVPNYLNVSPAISPNGDKVAFISDRRGSQNIYLMSALDGRIIRTLVSGERSKSFEELKFLRPGMSFSPDGKKLAFAAKSGSHDAIYIVEVKNGNITNYDLKDLDGAFTTSWSPDGEKIAFVGNKNNQSDIYYLNLSDQEVVQLTNDVFTDDQPSWSPDSKRLAFVSDRKEFLNNVPLPDDFQMTKHDYEKRDIYILQLADQQMERVTDTPWSESNPLFAPDGKRMAYLSERNGISNLYIHHFDRPTGYFDPVLIDSGAVSDVNLSQLESLNDYPVTNIISGVLQINWDRNANKMVFSSFNKGGFDIYMVNNPMEMSPKVLRDTEFVKDMKSEKLPVYARNWQSDKKTPQSITKGDQSSPISYSNYVFTRYKMDKAKEEEEKIVELDTTTYLNAEGDFKVRKYKLKFSPDVVTGAAGYNTFFGFSGYTTFAFSDLLGDHKIFLNVNLVSDLKNSDLSIFYLNLKKRISLGFGGYHLAWVFSNGFQLQRYRNYGLNVLASYPFSKFSRLEGSLNWYNILLENLSLSSAEDERVSTILPTISYVHDSVLWGYTGPIDGSRYALSLLASPKYETNSRDFRTVSADYRKYFMLNREYSMAFRMSGAASFGDNPQRFFLGGIDNWINYKTKNGGFRTNSIGDIFFSEFVTPLRGARYYEAEGSRYLLANMEFRFPLIQFLGLGFPPIRLFNIRGVMFYDIGTAYFPGKNWYSNDKWRATEVGEDGKRRFKDLVSGYGVGARVYFLYFLMRIDVAWNYDLEGSSKPMWYISLGGDL